MSKSNFVGDVIAIGPVKGGKLGPTDKIGTFRQLKNGTIAVTIKKVPMWGRVILKERPDQVRALSRKAAATPRPT